MTTVLIGGGTGFIGMHLSRRLQREGYEVRHLSRTEDLAAQFPAYHWDIHAGKIDPRALEGVTCVVNLAGAGIADERWSDARKQTIISSRTESTRLLARAMAEMDEKPEHYLSAGAIGYYGDRGEEWLTETATPGTGFLSKSCLLWEAAAEEIAAMGVPTFVNRTGIVLHPEAGALEKMLLPLKLWTSPYFGDGRQYYSWIHIEDLVGIYAHAIEEGLAGTYNGCAPNPVRNRYFAEALGPALGKSTVSVPAPAAALQLALGEMSHTVLDSARCSAAKIEATGYRFVYPELSMALEQLLA